ncbi:MAG: TolC family protein [Gemmataceae bacterium]
MSEGDYRNCQTLALSDLPQNEPVTTPGSVEVQTITTALHPAAQKRPISLQECIALALENGRTGLNFGRRVTATGVQPPGGALSARTDSIRVFAIEPAVFGATVERSLARFDSIWQSSMAWNKIDEPVNNIVFGGQSLTPGVLDADQAQFNTGLLKPLPTGGLAGITYRTDYNFSNQPLRLQPSYTPVLTFGFEQPLLQGAGVEINQLRDLHPSGVGLPFLPGGPVPGIMLARISLNQSQAEFQGQVHELLFAVEEAYWQLYFAYWDLYARDVALLQALTLWQIVEDRFKAGRIDAASKAQTESQLQAFRADRLQALSRGRLGRLGVLEAERKLRYLVGLPYEDGCRLIPSDMPTVVPLQPDWNSAVQEALVRRPELTQARQEVQAAQLVIKREKNFLLPELRFFADYNINALDSRLDDALRMLGDGRFNDWTMGLRAEVPIGFRAANAEVRKANLRLAQAFYFLRDQEQKVRLDLQRSYRDLVQAAKEIQYRRAQREQAAIEVRGRFENFVNGRPGVTLDVLADLLLRAQRNFADALTEEHRAIFEYNAALADFEFQKGTIMEHDNVSIAEGPLPACAVTRASEHIREQDRSLKLLDSPGCPSGKCGPQAPCAVPAPETGPSGGPAMPELPTGDPLPMPRILERNKDLSELLEKPPPPELAPSPQALPPDNFGGK